MSLSDWLYLLIAVMTCAAGFSLGRWSKTRSHRAALPTDWSVMARPVLNGDERHTLRLLRDALPQHVILAKLPLVRFCQARDPQKARYWYDLLAPLHVSFVVCSAGGRVLAVVDLEPDRGVSRRTATIKQAVMDACRIKYLSCRAENLPPIGELQLLLRPQGPNTRPAPLHGLQQARTTLADTVRNRRAERSVRWADSGLPPDSFFAPDSRFDSAPPSEFPPSDPTAAPAGSPPRRSR